jgi:hypothetical protein
MALVFAPFATEAPMSIELLHPSRLRQARQRVTRALLAMSAGLALMVSVPAQALQVLQVYTGTVTSGTDIEGVFGPAGASLAGRPFTATFLFDTALGNISTGPIGAPGSYVQLAGGSDPGPPFSGTATPLLGATIRIGSSAAVSVPGGQQDRTSVRSSNVPLNTPSEYLSSSVSAIGDYLYAFVRSSAATYPANLEVPGTYDTFPLPGATTDGRVDLKNPVTFGSRAVADLKPERLVVSVVPEPGGVLLMAAGLAALGLWRRRQRSPESQV